MGSLQDKMAAELHRQEIRANKKTLIGFVWLLGTSFIVWLLTLTRIFLIDLEKVSFAFVVSCIMCLPLIIIPIKRLYEHRCVKYILLVMVCCVVAVMTGTITFHVEFMYILPLLYAIQYHEEKVLWVTFVVNNITMLISTILGFYFGLCDLNLLFASNHTRDWYLDYMNSVVGNVPMNDNPMFVLVVFEFFPRVMMLFLFTIMLRQIVIGGSEYARRIADLTFRKETDLATGLLNKNKYEEMLEEYYPKVNELAAIFWDLNNLKKVNDSLGHAVGDSMIRAMAGKLKMFEGERCRIYRIGGDEFVMLIDNPEENEPENIVVQMKMEMMLYSGECDITLSAAVGIAKGKGSDIEEVVKKADKAMYEDKLSGKRAGLW